MPSPCPRWPTRCTSTWPGSSAPRLLLPLHRRRRAQPRRARAHRSRARRARAAARLRRRLLPELPVGLLHRAAAHGRGGARRRAPPRRLRLRERPLGPSPVRPQGPEVVTLAGYRDRYALYKSDPDLMAAHARRALVVTWDDHEVENNYANALPWDDTPPERFLARRAAAYQAFYEHMPCGAPRCPRARTSASTGAFRTETAELHVLDTRQYRTNQPCGDGWEALPGGLRPPGDPARGRAEGVAPRGAAPLPRPLRHPPEPGALRADRQRRRPRRQVRRRQVGRLPGGAPYPQRGLRSAGRGR